jgi:hypothetical protein
MDVCRHCQVPADAAHPSLLVEDRKYQEWQDMPLRSFCLSLQAPVFVSPAAALRRWTNVAPVRLCNISKTDVVFCNSLDGRRPANLQTALVTWYASASEL